MEAANGDTYRDDSNTWTHVTSRDEAIQKIKQQKKFLGPNEDTSEFSYEINKGVSANKQNPNSPNFYKGKLYPGAEGGKYLITITPKQSYPGDDFISDNWKDVDYPLIPNGNRTNKQSFKKSSNIGVLKPEYRNVDNLTFYKYNEDTKTYEEFNIDEFNPQS